MNEKWAIERKRPYTKIGIRRLGCIRCGKPADCQWQICADGNNYRPLCSQCDVKINAMVLRWMKHPHAELIARIYLQKKLEPCPE